MSIEALPGLIHHHIVRGLLHQGHAPRMPDLAAQFGVPLSQIERALKMLADDHGAVLHPHACEPWIVHPFALSPSATWVQGTGKGWWAPCLWCAMGIAELAQSAITISTRLGGERDCLEIGVEDGQVTHDDLLVHYAKPPHAAWDNVHHYCAMVLPFRSEQEIDTWSERHDLPRGEAVPLQTVADLGRQWYGRHADADWQKWTREEAQAIFRDVGLTGAFWDLGGGEGRF